VRMCIHVCACMRVYVCAHVYACVIMSVWQHAVANVLLLEKCMQIMGLN
jgi:hypothetical protein